MEEEKKFDKHIFICVNERKGGDRRSCGEDHGMELVKAFKKKLKDLSLPIKIRAQRAGCLDVCDYGPTLVIYPDGVFYVGVKVKDVDEIIESHIVNGRIVERLKLPASKY
jgi:(2Fe-2S) ferredoxin